MFHQMNHIINIINNKTQLYTSLRVNYFAIIALQAIEIKFSWKFYWKKEMSKCYIIDEQVLNYGWASVIFRDKQVLYLKMSKCYI